MMWRASFVRSFARSLIPPTHRHHGAWSDRLTPAASAAV